MIALTTIEAPACPLGLEHVDTDQLIPARFMQTPRAKGYGGFLLHDLRRGADGALRGDLAVNDARYAQAQVMIARANFGCGSSREAAVYVLADAGYRCVLAPSFGDIFSSNAVKNGVLPARVSPADIEALLGDPVVLAGGAIRVDLAAQTVSVGNKSIPFEVRADWKKQLLNGWDDVDLTQSYAKDIADFAARYRVERPWATPRAG